MNFLTSTTTEKLDQALAKAQGQIGNAKKSSENPHFRSKYADLASIWSACKPALLEYGLSVTQWPLHSDDGKAHLLTRISHQGEFIQATFSIPVSKQDPQGYKSAITYLKRIGLESALGIPSEDDDDGQEASKEPTRPIAAREAFKPDIAKHLPLKANGRTSVSDLVNAQEKAIVNHADKLQKNPPNFQDEPMPTFQDGPMTEAAGEWIIPFGKFKDVKIGDIKKPELQRYIAYLTETTAKDGKPMSKGAQDLINQCKLMWSVDHLDEIPF